MPKQPGGLVQAALDALAALEPGSEDPPGFLEITIFLAAISDLCLTYGTDLLQAPALQGFVDEAAPDLNRLSIPLMFLSGTLLIMSRGIWEADEWRQLCDRRSGLQFMLDLFRDSDAWSVVEGMETKLLELDTFVYDRGMLEGHFDDHEIDAALPATHWWWWLPQQAPRNNGP